MKEPHRPPTTLTEFEFRSRLPVLGGLVSGFRWAWHAVAGRWALRWLAQQQDRINRSVAETLNGHAEILNRQQEELRRQQEELARQQAELARQQAELARQAQALSDQTDLNEKLNAHSAHVTARMSAIEHRQSQMSALLAEVDQRLMTFAQAAADRNDARIREAGDLAATLTARIQGLEGAAQAYLEELGHEVADLAVRVGELGPNDEAPGPYGA